MKYYKLIGLLITVVILNVSYAGRFNFRLINVVDVQTTEGNIIAIEDIVDGTEEVSAISIIDNNLFIDSDIQNNGIKDIQLDNGQIIILDPNITLLPGGGGDIGGGSNN